MAVGHERTTTYLERKMRVQYEYLYNIVVYESTCMTCRCWRVQYNDMLGGTTNEGRVWDTGIYQNNARGVLSGAALCWRFMFLGGHIGLSTRT